MYPRKIASFVLIVEHGENSSESNSWKKLKSILMMKKLQELRPVDTYFKHLDGARNVTDVNFCAVPRKRR